MPVLERLGTVGRSMRRALRALAGEDAYERYLAYQQAAHPGCVVMTEREFWRDRTDSQDRNPGGRCC